MIRRILRMPEVERAVGAKKSKIYAEINAGRFPRSVSIFANSRVRGWLSTEIDEYIERRAMERNAYVGDSHVDGEIDKPKGQRP